MVYSVTIVVGSMGAIPIEVGYFSDETVLQPSSGWFLLQDELKAMPPPQQLPNLIEDGHEVSCWIRWTTNKVPSFYEDEVPMILGQ